MGCFLEKAKKNIKKTLGAQSFLKMHFSFVNIVVFGGLCDILLDLQKQNDRITSPTICTYRAMKK